MNRTILLITLLAPTIGLAQRPSTQPRIGYDPAVRGAHEGAGLTSARIILAPGIISAINISELSSINSMSAPVAAGTTRGILWSRGFPGASQESDRAVRMMFSASISTDPKLLFPDQWQRALRQPATAPSSRGRGGGGSLFGGLGATIAEQWFLEMIEPEMQKIRVELLNQLRTLVRSEPEMSPPDRARRVTEVTAALGSLQERMSVLQNLTAAQPDAPKRLAEKVRQLHDLEQGLQMNLAAQEARREALQRGLAELKKQADEQRQQDPVAEEMRKILDLRERELKRSMQLVQSGVVSAGEVARAEADLAETKLRLLERQAVIGKGGKGELMDRLTDELAMVSINSTDLQIQISQLRSEIARNDPARLNGAALDDLLKREPGLVPGTSDKMPPLYQELEKQSAELRLEWLKLVVDDVEILPDQPAAQ